MVRLSDKAQLARPFAVASRACPEVCGTRPIGAAGELAGSFPDDNLTIPIASAAGAYGALSLLGIA